MPIARGKSKVTLTERLIRGKPSQCLVVTSPDGRTLYVSPEGDVDEWMRAITSLEPPPNAAELRRNTIGDRPVVSADLSGAEAGGDEASSPEGEFECSKQRTLTLCMNCDQTRVRDTWHAFLC